MLVTFTSRTLRLCLYIIAFPTLLCFGACDRSTSVALPAPNATLAHGSGQFTKELTELSTTSRSPSVKADTLAQPPEAIVQFCGDCHALPRADSFDRDVWYQEIRQGYEFYARLACHR